MSVVTKFNFSSLGFPLSCGTRVEVRWLVKGESFEVALKAKDFDGALCRTIEWTVPDEESRIIRRVTQSGARTIVYADSEHEAVRLIELYLRETMIGTHDGLPVGITPKAHLGGC